MFRPASLPGFPAFDGPDLVGVATYRRSTSDTVEVVTIDAIRPRSGIGTALLDAVAAVAAELGATRLVLTTTNDNVDALRCYQRRVSAWSHSGPMPRRDPADTSRKSR